MDSKQLTIYIGSFIATSDERDDDDDDDADDDDADDGKWTSITLTGTSSVIKKKNECFRLTFLLTDTGIWVIMRLLGHTFCRLNKICSFLFDYLKMILYAMKKKSNAGKTA